MISLRFQPLWHLLKMKSFFKSLSFLHAFQLLCCMYIAATQVCKSLPRQIVVNLVRVHVVEKQDNKYCCKSYQSTHMTHAQGEAIFTKSIKLSTSNIIGKEFNFENWLQTLEFSNQEGWHCWKGSNYVRRLICKSYLSSLVFGTTHDFV